MGEPSVTTRTNATPDWEPNIKLGEIDRDSIHCPQAENYCVVLSSSQRPQVYIKAGDGIVRNENSAAQLEALKKLRLRTSFVNTDLFNSRSYEAILNKITNGPSITVHSGSSYSITASDCTSGMASGLLAVYGNISSSNFPDLEKDSVFTQLQYYDPQAGASRAMFVGGEGWPVDIYKGSYDYTFVENEKKAVPEGWDASLTFLQSNMGKIDAACEILYAAFPELPKDILKMAYIRLNFFELNAYNDLDVKQDLVAVNTSGSRYADAYNNEYTGFMSPLNWSLSTTAGAWLARGAAATALPIDEQGLGPIQIIPRLVMALEKYPDLEAQFAEQLTGIDLKSIDSVVQACFDPEKMFILKAVTWAIQLQQVKNNGGFTLPISGYPFIADNILSQNMGQIIAADTLVQIPNMPQSELAQYFAGYGAADYMLELYQLTDLLGAKLDIPHVTRLTSAPLSNDNERYLGYYQLGGTGNLVHFTYREVLEQGQRGIAKSQ